MTYQELVQHAKQLALRERLALIEQLIRSVRRELTPPSQAMTDAELIHMLVAQGTSLERVLGMAKLDGPPPTDEEVTDMYVDYLSGKICLKWRNVYDLPRTCGRD